MNFQKYDIYNNNKLKELNNNLKELNNKLFIYTLTLRDSERKVLDKVELSQKEYSESGNKYSNYNSSKRNNKNIQNEINKVQSEINIFRDNFKKKIKYTLFQDIAEDLSIDSDNVFKIVKYALNRNFLSLKMSNIYDIETEDIENLEFYNFDCFMDNNFQLSQQLSEDIYDIVVNEVEFLSIKL